MWKLLSPAIVLPALLVALPAGAATRDEARAECQKLYTGYGLKESARTGVTRQQKISGCIREKLSANKRRKI